MQISPVVFQALANRQANSSAPARLAVIQAAMTPEWAQDLDQRVRRLVKEPSAIHIKIRKLYSLVDEAHQPRAPVVACKRGCNACCHIRVELHEAEAQMIAKATGRTARQLPPGRHTTPISKLGRPDTPCTFLVDGECSIYEHRPFACRELAVVDEDNLTCSFENMHLQRQGDPRTVPVPEARIEPLQRAWIEILKEARRVTFADIRQFFP